MKPKTKLQKRVVELSKKLRPITEKQLQWGYEKCLDKNVTRSKKKLYCLECGHEWPDDLPLLTDIEQGCQCPACGKKLLIRTNFRHGYQSGYYGIITTVKEMQVIRIFNLKKWMKKNHPCELSYEEVMIHFISPEGEITTMSIAVNGMSMYMDQWVVGSEMEIRTSRGSYRTQQRHGIVPFAFYPTRNVLRIIKRNGYAGSFYGMVPQKFFSNILKNQRFETLLKAGQIALMKYYAYGQTYADKIDLHWDSVKIAIRNRYTITDAGDWIDYLNLLNHFGKDTRSPKCICPADLKKEHDRYVKKKREQDRIIGLEKQREKIAEEEREYQEQKKPFFELEFRDENITVDPLRSVKEFFEEGEAMGHCVFSNRYYKKPESLVMSAKVEGEKMETIELSLESLKIVQARGKGNKATEYHESIINLVERNLPAISRILQTQ